MAARRYKLWMEEIEAMREVLVQYEGRGSVYFEYNIPRMGRRVDKSSGTGALICKKA